MDPIPHCFALLLIKYCKHICNVHFLDTTTDVNHTQVSRRYLRHYWHEINMVRTLGMNQFGSWKMLKRKLSAAEGGHRACYPGHSTPQAKYSETGVKYGSQRTQAGNLPWTLPGTLARNLSWGPFRGTFPGNLSWEPLLGTLPGNLSWRPFQVILVGEPSREP